MSQQGSVLGATLLIAGCCIGAGMLSLPVAAALTGFIPTLVMFVLVWFFMMVTGLLLLEVNLWFKEDVSLITMADRTLGKIGKTLTWGLFLLLFYAIMVAYISGAGLLVQEWFGLAIGEVAVALVFGLMVYLGTTVVDLSNRIMMIGLAVTYLLLVVIGAPYVKMENLSATNWNASFGVIPLMVISFGYHNLVPSVSNYLDHNKRKAQISIVLGSFIPLLLYLIWDYVILGLIPPGSVIMATRALHNVSGVPWVATVADAFAFFAIVTSFLGVALSLVDFLADGFHITERKQPLALAAVLPPLVFAMIYPGVFITALAYGGIVALILFGILPPLMVWSGRYVQKIATVRAFPAGKTAILTVLIVAIVMVISQVKGMV